MGYSAEQARSVATAVLSGDKQITPVMNSTGSYTFELTGPSQKFAVQSSGNLAFTYATSANGINFTTPVSVAANVLTTDSTNVVSVVSIAWVSGSGKVTILAS